MQSGFSINNDFLVENFQWSLYCCTTSGLRWDGIVHAGELEMLKLKSMVKNMNMSHSCYKDDLKREKEERSKKRGGKHRND